MKWGAAAVIVLFFTAFLFVSKSEARPYTFHIQSVNSLGAGKWEVNTPAAKIEILDGWVKFTQTLNANRLLANVIISGAGGASWTRTTVSTYEEKFTYGSFEIHVYGDSVVRIRGAESVSLYRDGTFDPEYRYAEDGSAIFADPVGGVGIYGPRGTRTVTAGMETGGAWSVVYPSFSTNLQGEAFRENNGTTADDADVLISVFPPRPFDWSQARTEKIAHFFPKLESYEWREGRDWKILSTEPTPTNAQIDDYAAKGFNVLVLHLEVFFDYGVPDIKPLGYSPDQDSPVPLSAFTNAVTHAHSKGMKVLLYTSPYYYGTYDQAHHSLTSVSSFMTGSVDYLLTIMSDVLGYPASENPDGLYFDGTYLGVEKAWQVARETRSALGDDKLLYVHNTQMPFWHPRIPAPFIDTYADYTLRGESFQYPYTGSSPSTLTRSSMDPANYRLRNMDPLYLRYFVSGYNMGNQIGTLSYENARLDDSSIANGGIINTLLGVNARLPYWPGFQVNTGWNYFLYEPGVHSPVEKENAFWGDEKSRYLNSYLPNVSGITSESAIPGYASANSVRAAWLTGWRTEMANRRSNLANYLNDRKNTMGSGSPVNLAAFKATEMSARGAWEDDATELHKLGAVAEYATDRNPDTYWRAENAPAWLEVDLGSNERINRVVVNNYRSGVTDYYHYKVQVSMDRKNYTTVATKSNNNLATAKGDNWVFPTVSARYVRVIMLDYDAAKVNPWKSQYISELEVYKATVKNDYDGDGKTDLVLLRTVNGYYQWRIATSSSGYTTTQTVIWGSPGDMAVPADYDGDGKMDPAYYHPQDQTWHIARSADQTEQVLTWGYAGDIPQPADWDGDGKADPAMYRPGIAPSYTSQWLIAPSSSNYWPAWHFDHGLSNQNDNPVGSLFDQDRLADPAVYRPSTFTWYMLPSYSTYAPLQSYVHGAANDVPVIGDVDGDGKTDLGVYRPSTGHILTKTSSSGYTTVSDAALTAGGVPVLGDFDGDGISDPCVYKEGASSTFKILLSSTSAYVTYSFGTTGDMPPGIPGQ